MKKISWKTLWQGLGAYLIILALSVPAFAVVNCSGNWWINLFGLSYSINLILFLRHTRYGKWILSTIETLFDCTDDEFR